MLKSITNLFEQKKWMYTPKEGEQFFFMHIPKTGGSTFRKMLTNHFPESSYYPTQADLFANSGRYYSQKELVENHSELLERPLIMGHYSIDLIQHLRPNVKVITFFRNPLDRILSHVKHLLRNDVIFKEMDPNEVIEKRIKYLCLVQSRAMGFIPKLKNFDVVSQSINRLDFIGIQEDYDDSIKEINKKFHWNLDQVEAENKSEDSIYSSLTPKTKSLIASHMGKDLFTYSAAKRISEQKEKSVLV